MKLSLILCVVAIGCMPKAVQPEVPRVIEVAPAPVPVKPVVEIEPEPEPIVHTWITGEDLKAIEVERLRQAMESAVNSGTRCYAGDPMCGVIETN